MHKQRSSFRNQSPFHVNIQIALSPDNEKEVANIQDDILSMDSVDSYEQERDEINILDFDDFNSASKKKS